MNPDLSAQLARLAEERRAQRLAYQRRAEEIHRLIDDASRINREAMASLDRVIERGSGQILKNLPSV